MNVRIHKIQTLRHTSKDGEGRVGILWGMKQIDHRMELTINDNLTILEQLNSV